MRHGWDATNFRCALSRWYRSLGMASASLAMGKNRLWLVLSRVWDLAFVAGACRFGSCAPSLAAGRLRRFRRSPDAHRQTFRCCRLERARPGTHAIQRYRFCREGSFDALGLFCWKLIFGFKQICSSPIEVSKRRAVLDFFDQLQ